MKRFLVFALLVACGSDPRDPTPERDARVDPVAKEDAAVRDGSILDAAPRADAAPLDAAVDVVDAFVADAAAPSADGYLELSLAYGQNCVISAARELICWGLRAGNFIGRRPGLVAADTGNGHWLDWEHVWTGSGGACAVRDGGKLYCWALPATLNPPSDDIYAWTLPTRFLDWTGVKRVSVAEQSYCAVKSDGSLWCWGSDAGGQLGVGAPTSFAKCGGNRCSRTPVRVGTASDWSFVTGSDAFHCGVRGGELYCWGMLAQQLGSSGETCLLEYEDPMYPSTTVPCAKRPMRVFSDYADFDQVAISRGGLCARRRNGEVVCRFDDTYQPTAPGPSPSGTFTQVAVGHRHGCVLAEGRLRCWGDNARGQLGDGVLDHMASCWPSDDCSPQPVEVAHPSGVAWAQVAATRDYTCALDVRGTAYCWGEDDGYSFGSLLAVENCSGSNCSRVPLAVSKPYRCDEFTGPVCTP